jgi:hypothetical protein
MRQPFELTQDLDASITFFFRLAPEKSRAEGAQARFRLENTSQTQALTANCLGTESLRYYLSYY